MLQVDPYAVALLVSAGISAIVAVMSWRRRSATPAATALTLFLLGNVQWAGFEGLAQLVDARPWQGVFLLADIPGSSILAAGFFWLCRLMIDPNALLPPRMRLVLWAEPMLLTLAVATNGLHGWVLPELERLPSGLLAAPPGPLLWLHIAYGYSVISWSGVALLRVWRTGSALHRRQIRTVLLSGVCPVAASLPTLIAVGMGIGSYDLSAIAFTVIGLFVWWALFRQGLLRLVPVARAVVLERVSDAVIVIDPAGTVLDLNPAAIRLGRRIRSDLPADPVGHSFFRILGTNRPMQGPPPDGAYRLPLPEIELHLDVRSSRLTDRRGNLVGHAVVVRDVTEPYERRRELAAVNTRLREQVVVIERLRADLAEQAVRDVLTGLHNRRHLMQVIEREFAEATATGEALGVVLLDIDHFKQVNDRLGHAAGDRLLVSVAQVLAAGCRPRDTLTRYGGEEFVALLPGATIDQAWERAEQWRKRCGTASGVTLSAGVAVFPGCGGSPEDLLDAADRALYAAKAAGRDRVSAAPSGR